MFHYFSFKKGRHNRGILSALLSSYDMYIVYFYVIESSSRADKIPLWIDQDKDEFIISYGPGACNISMLYALYPHTRSLSDPFHS